MSNCINLGPTQTAPAVQGLAVQAASQQDSSSLFSALLMQQMNGSAINGDGDTESTTALSQGLFSNTALMKLLPSFLAQGKDAKAGIPADAKNTTQSDATNDNPALAIWIASMMTAQIQHPNAPNGAQLDGLASQLAGNGTDQNALQALEQQFPGLISALKDNHTGAKPEADKPQVEASASDANNDFDGALNAIHAAEGKKADPSQSPAHMSENLSPDSTKASSALDKNKAEQKDPAGKDIVANPAAKEGQRELIQAGSQSQGANPNQQDQEHSQPGDSRPGNQQKKSNTSDGQAQQGVSQANNSATTAPVQQNNFAATTQTIPHSVAADSSNHPAASAVGQPINLREAGSAVVVDAAPRIVHAAPLIQAASQAEMRVSVKNDISGTVDIRAMLEGNHISATVAAQHGGTRDWLMANLHELQSSLSRDDLNLRNFEVSDSALQNNQQGSGQGQQEQQQRNLPYSQFANETYPAAANLEDTDLNGTSLHENDLHENSLQPYGLQGKTSRALNLLA